MEFRRKTKIKKGDFGVVIYRDKWVPVFVADGGPYNKLGEGSAALLKELNEDRCSHKNTKGFCDLYNNKSIPDSVVTIIFPGSNKPGMMRENVAAWTCEAVHARLALAGSPLCPP